MSSWQSSRGVSVELGSMGSGSCIELTFDRHAARGTTTASHRISSLDLRFHCKARLLLSNIDSFLYQVLPDETEGQFGPHALVPASHYLLLLVAEVLRIRIGLVLVPAVLMLRLGESLILILDATHKGIPSVNWIFEKVALHSR